MIKKTNKRSKIFHQTHWSDQSQDQRSKLLLQRRLQRHQVRKSKNPKRVAAGKALAAKNKEKLAKIKAFEESELAKKDQQTSEATEGDQTESVKQPAERPNSNQDWSSSLIFLVGGVAVVGGLSAFGYQKWTASANQQSSRPVKQPVTQPNATKPSEPAKRSEAVGDNQEKNSDPFGDL